jgi:hypothetical protein
MARAFNLDAMPGKDLRLPVERRVIAILAHEHLGEQCRCCEPASNWAFRRCRLHHFVADPACIFGTRGADHAEPSWHSIEHLGFALADPMHCPATARTSIAWNIEQNLFTRQMIGQRLAIHHRA